MRQAITRERVTPKSTITEDMRVVEGGSTRRSFIAEGQRGGGGGGGDGHLGKGHPSDLGKKMRTLRGE